MAFFTRIDEGGKIRKVLVNRLVYDGIRHIPRGRKIDIVPIEIRSTARMIRALENIRASSIPEAKMALRSPQVLSRTITEGGVL